MNKNDLIFHCPLCCNETFDSLEQFKNHILELKNKLNCPICDENCQDLQEFSNHLDQCCVESADSSEFSEKNDLQNEENDTECEIETAVSPSLTGFSDENQYFCEICDVNFSEIKEHLTTYHMGEEILLDSQNLEALEESNFDCSETDGSQIKEEHNVTQDSEHIILEQEVLNENGKYYTKKITKIDIVQDSPMKKTPILEKYEILDQGTSLPGEINSVGSTAITVYRCSDCELQFDKFLDFSKHNCTSKEAAYYCSKCMIEFTTKNMLMHHKRKLHNEAKAPNQKVPTECDICHIMFPSEKSMLLHRTMHTRKLKSPAIDPPVSYDIVGSKIREENNEKFTCNVCGKEFNNQYKEIHMKSHTDSLYNCSLCNRKFTDKSVLDLHAQAHGNDGEKKISCGYCKKMFMNEKALTQHVQTQCEERKYTCNFCGRKFLRPHEKVKHERIHTGIKPHKCEVCGKAFRVGYCLTLHLRTHSGIRPYHCETCGKRFKSHGVYKHHIKTHSENRPYMCTFCPKSFKTGVQLAGHKNTHTKPFSCKVCNRPFASLYNVKLHMKTHNVENNLSYECPICGANYARSFALRDHLLTHSEHFPGDTLVESYITKKTGLKRKLKVSSSKNIDFLEDSQSKEKEQVVTS